MNSKTTRASPKATPRPTTSKRLGATTARTGKATKAATAPKGRVKRRRKITAKQAKEAAALRARRWAFWWPVLDYGAGFALLAGGVLGLMRFLGRI